MTGKSVFKDFSYFLLRSSLFLAVFSLGRFLGPEGTAIMTTGKNLIIFGVLIFLLIILFRRIKSKIKYGFLKVSIYLSLLFLILVYGSLVRCYFLSHFDIYLSDILPCFIFCVSHSSLSTSNDGTSSSTTHIVSDSPHSLIIPENTQPGGNLLSVFGTQDPDGEIELFARIRNLEDLLIDRLPPQLHSGEYENLVRDNLNQAKDILHYRSALSNELFDITVLELKANLQERLFDLFLNEPNERLLLLFRESPFPERAVRSEALEFIEGRLDLLNLGNPHPHAYPEKVMLQNTLEQWLNNLVEFRQNAIVYAEFIAHFRGM